MDILHEHQPVRLGIQKPKEIFVTDASLARDVMVIGRGDDVLDPAFAGDAKFGIGKQTEVAGGVELDGREQDIIHRRWINPRSRQSNIRSPLRQTFQHSPVT